MLRLTWVQPEDLLGHELRQAAQDGREAGAIAARWRAAGGAPAPDRAGASPRPASRYLRQLAEDLLDELADLPGRLADSEPTDLARIRASCPDWPAPPTGGSAVPPAAALEAAWLGRAAGCLLGKPVEKLPLDAIRLLGRASGAWPPAGYFTARGVPAELLAAHPWNRRSATTSLAENIDGMPEDDDLNYPLLNLLLLRRHGRDFTTRDVAALWLDELPAGRTFTAERVAYRNLLSGVEPPRTARLRNPFREWIGALIRADVHGWTNPGDPAAAAAQAHRDATLTHTANGVYAAMFIAAVIAAAAGGPAVGMAVSARGTGSPADSSTVPADGTRSPAGSTGTSVDAGLAGPPAPAGAIAADGGAGPAGTTALAGAPRDAGSAGGTGAAGRVGPAGPTAGAGVPGPATGAGVPSPATGAGAGGRGGSAVHDCLRAGLAVVPNGSRLARAVREAIRLARAHDDFDDVVDALHARHAGTYHWVHAIPNAALIAAALTHADGDFDGSIRRAVSGGWDTDSNGATAGSIAGLLAGSPAALPERWTAPLKNRLASSVADFDGVGFDTLAHLTHLEASRP
ncbi:ADP-ribosylglycohydrolase family protein [Streptomyces mangrovisoli]|uniref:ADP-ribosylglycohydrolase family protein n=1 Tax=Streptomyces mangrovisoli TaxID=1428628 RepID=UPI0009A1289F|nr:ADP-ribosylglycohydrolase family protein [Streptomyces mangrovisoli]